MYQGMIRGMYRAEPSWRPGSWAGQSAQRSWLRPALGPVWRLRERALTRAQVFRRGLLLPAGKPARPWRPARRWEPAPS